MGNSKNDNFSYTQSILLICEQMKLYRTSRRNNTKSRHLLGGRRQDESVSKQRSTPRSFGMVGLIMGGPSGMHGEFNFFLILFYIIFSQGPFFRCVYLDICMILILLFLIANIAMNNKNNMTNYDFEKDKRRS